MVGKKNKNIDPQLRKYGCKKDVFINPDRTDDNSPLVLFRFHVFKCTCSKEWVSGYKRDLKGSKCFRCNITVLPDPTKEFTLTTPFHRKDIRVYGYFECHVCSATKPSQTTAAKPTSGWSSAYSWSGCYQQCLKCATCVYPYQQHQLLRGGGGKKNRPGHQNYLCEKCKMIGANCQTVKQAKSGPRRTPPAAIQNNEE